MKCINCKYGKISNGENTIIENNIIITQTGKDNVICQCNDIKSITIDVNGFNCSNYEKREDETND